MGHAHDQEVRNFGAVRGAVEDRVVVLRREVAHVALERAEGKLRDDIALLGVRL